MAESELVSEEARRAVARLEEGNVYVGDFGEAIIQDAIRSAIDAERHACAALARSFSRGHSPSEFDQGWHTAFEFIAEQILMRGEANDTIHSQPPPQGEQEIV